MDDRELAPSSSGKTVDVGAMIAANTLFLENATPPTGSSLPMVAGGIVGVDEQRARWRCVAHADGTTTEVIARASVKVLTVLSLHGLGGMAVCGVHTDTLAPRGPLLPSAK